jgi:hypothetical protein
VTAIPWQSVRAVDASRMCLAMLSFPTLSGRGGSPPILVQTYQGARQLEGSDSVIGYSFNERFPGGGILDTIRLAR